MHNTQEKLLKFIKRQGSFSLSYRKLGSAIGELHPQKIKHHLEQLEKKGFLKIDKRAEKIEFLKAGKIKKSNLVAIPIIGAANCGPATIFADQCIDGFLKISEKFLKKKQNLFAIRVVGNSMNEADIDGKKLEEGDYAIIDSEVSAPRSGDYVLSIIDDVANIKRYKEDKKNKQIVLLSESTQKYPPIFIHPDDKFAINGKIIQVIKNPN